MSNLATQGVLLNPHEAESLYQTRLARYVTAMRNEKPDRIPIRPFLAEFCGTVAGFDAMQQTHDYRNAFQAVQETARQFDCDALVTNMVYNWTGLTEGIGLKYYGVPGIAASADHGFQYLEPAEEKAWMHPEEYDQLIENPTLYLYETWLPRVSKQVVSPGTSATLANQLALVRGGMSMLSYFNAFGEQTAKLRQLGMPSALTGILKAPLDIIADKLRGYMGLLTDLRERPEQVLAACKALAPHLLHTALSGADPEKLLPVGFWMHRSCVPFVRPEHFNDIFWPTLRPILEHLWAAGHQTLMYAEGSWDHHLDAFAELPEGSVVYHVDQGDIFKVHERLGSKFCISGGIPSSLLSYGTVEQIHEKCKEVIDRVAGDGGYILDASAIVQQDARVENVQAMINFTREHGIYGDGSEPEIIAPSAKAPPHEPMPMPNRLSTHPPGSCVAWAEKRSEYKQIERHEDLVERIWSEVDGFADMFIWQILVSF